MEINLEIDGMHCATCAQTVEKNLRKVKGVKEATVNLVVETAYIECEDSVSIDSLIKAVQKAGYEAFESTS